MSIPTGPIKNDAAERVTKDSGRSRKAEPNEGKFQEELDSTKSVARLKKHSKSLDSETDEELGIKEERKEPVSLFDLSANKKTKKELSFNLNQPNETLQPIQGEAKHQSEGFISAIAGKVERAPIDTSKLVEIAQKIISEIQQMELNGKTETIVSLVHPPILKGAHLVLTSFATAKGEYNIAFENLSPQAKALLDSNQNLDILKMNLEQKGYITHMITTSTVSESRPFVAEPGQSQREQSNQQQERQNKGKQQQKDEENRG